MVVNTVSDINAKNTIANISRVAILTGAVNYSPNNPSPTPKINHQQSTTSTPACPITGNPGEKDDAKKPRNPEPFSAINTPPAPSNPAPFPTTTPPSAAPPTNAIPPNVPPRISSPPPTAAATNATSTIVFGPARARIDFAIGTSARWENV
ncbi:hypothetical protein BPAE_0291g00100 [Botrytis paeoniae]|uniref:Uncharacterized protein n=1 Tax=Botrytis paeoniae TaxID=278948 RepID=A0A4Z1FGC0_9HELO|nr:hypothetical protein BPAE_0291g00100 [Botrytis paeoniae]